MTNTITMPPVIGWKVGPNWDYGLSATNEEVCNAFGVKVPEWLDEDGSELFDTCWDDHGSLCFNDDFAGFCYALTLDPDNGICYDREFPDLDRADWFAGGVQDAFEATIGTCESVYAYWDTTQTDFIGVRELLLDTVEQTADDLGISTEDHDKWKNENGNNIRLDFTNNTKE